MAIDDLRGGFNAAALLNDRRRRVQSISHDVAFVQNLHVVKRQSVQDHHVPYECRNCTVRGMQTQWFKDRMKRLHVTQEQVGKAFNLDRSVVSRIISGDQELALSQVLPLARLLRVSPFEILNRAGIWDSASPPDAARLREWFDLFEEMPEHDRPGAVAIVKAYRQR